MILEILIPIFLLMCLGYGFRQSDLLPNDFYKGLDTLVYYLFLPVLIFKQTLLAEFKDTDFFGITSSLILAGLFVSWALWMFRNKVTDDMPSFTSVFQGSTRFNTFIGLAVTIELYGSEGLVVATVAMGVLVIMANVTNVACFSVFIGSKKTFKQHITNILENPLVLACLLGFIMNPLQTNIPPWGMKTLDMVYGAALPIGIIAVGAGFNLDYFKASLKEYFSSMMVKFFFYPLVVLIFAFIFRVDITATIIMCIFAGLPTTVASYGLAVKLGGNKVLMANIIVLQSVFIFLVLPIWVYVLTNWVQKYWLW